MTKPWMFAKLAVSCTAEIWTLRNQHLFPHMESEKILEGLDSNWFFCNVFKPPPPSPISRKETHGAKQAQPNIAVHRTLQVRAPKIQEQPVSVATGEILEVDVSWTELTRKMGESSSSSSSSSRPGSKRREKRARTQEREETKGFRELGFVLEEVGLDRRLVSYVPSFRRTRERYGRSRSTAFHCKMPPYSDGMAMKEHLRSWAYAVACSVR